MKLAALLLLALVVSACGSGPTGPSASVPSGAAVAGTVTATNGGQALGGLSVDLGGQLATTNAAGAFTYAQVAGASARLTLTGAGIVPRSLTRALGGPLAVDAIALGAGFDLGFYRQFVRNTFDAPGGMEPLRRWTTNPNVYVQTVDDAGASVDAKNLDTAEIAIRETAGIWSAGKLAIASVERGPGTKAGVPGWITVQWRAAAVTGRCGQADVGLSGGTVDLFYKAAGSCQCGGTIRPRTVRHELGHAFGYWHTDNPADLMFASAPAAQCDALPSARELAHAAIAYARPVGNTDPDQDPTSAISLAPMTAR